MARPPRGGRASSFRAEGVNLHPYRWLVGALLFSPLSLVVLIALPSVAGLAWALLATVAVLGWHFYPAPSRRRMRVLLRIRAPRIPALGVLGFLAAFFLIQWGVFAFIEIAFHTASRIGPEDIPFYWTETDLTTPVGILAFGLLLAVALPAFEELVFRGRLQRHFERKGSVAKAIVIPSAIFALGHAGGPHWSLLLLFFTFAVLQARLTLHAGSIVPPILAHGAWNGSLFAGDLLPDFPAPSDGALWLICAVCLGVGLCSWLSLASRYPAPARRP